MAALNGRIETAKYLLDNGADLHAKNNNSSIPLHFAANKEVAEFLLSKGNKDNVHAKNNYGNTPLHLAASNRLIETAEYLLANGADVHAKNNYGNTPLHLAVSNGRIETAEYLLANGADINAITNQNLTPLYIAQKKGYIEIAKLLSEKGAKTYQQLVEDSSQSKTTANKDSQNATISHASDNTNPPLGKSDHTEMSEPLLESKKEKTKPIDKPKVRRSKNDKILLKNINKSRRPLKIGILVALSITAAGIIFTANPKSFLGHDNSKLKLGLSIATIVIGLAALALVSWMGYNKTLDDRQQNTADQKIKDDHSSINTNLDSRNVTEVSNKTPIQQSSQGITKT